MPEAVAPNNQQGAASGAQQPQQGQANGAQQPTSEPKWLSYIPEAEREEAKRGWMQEADYRKKTAEISEQRKSWEDQQKQYETLKTWYEKSYQPFFSQYGEALNKRWADIEPILRGQAPQTPQPQNQGQAHDAWESQFQNFEIKPGYEQAKLIADYVVNERVNAAMAALEKKLTDSYSQLFQQGKQYFDNYLDIMTDAYDQRFNNPKFPMKDYLQKRLQITYGQMDPRQLALDSVNGPQQLEDLKREWMEKGREEERLAAQNRQNPPGAFQNQSVTPLRGQAMTREQVAEAVRNNAIKNGIPWGNNFGG